MLVKVLKYSTTYPTGPQNKGDIIELTKEEAKHYIDLGWVEPLPKNMQTKKSKKKILEERNLVKDLSFVRRLEYEKRL